MRQFRSDLRRAWRSLARHRAFTAAVVATVALTVGVNAGVFSVVDAVILQPLAFPEARRLVAVCEYPERERDAACIATPPDAADLAASSRTLARVGLARDWPFVMRTAEGARGVSGGIATPSVFQVLGVRAEQGRTFAPDEIGADAAVAIVSHRFWRDRLGGTNAALDVPLVLGDKPYRIVGVLPADVRVPTLDYVDVWTPLPFPMGDETNRKWRGFRAFARLANGASMDAARRELALLGGRLRDAHFADKPDWRVEVRPLQDLVVGSARRPLLTFFGVVAFILLIGCANLANLFLARNAARAPEFALRTALGAPRRDLVRVVLTESVLASALGGILALPVAIWFSRAFVALAPGDLPRLDEVQVDARAFAFALALSIVAGLAFGLLPALRSSRVEIRTSLGDAPRGSSGRRAPLGRLIVGIELALTIMLVAGAGLFIRSLLTLSRWDPGVPADRVVTTWLLASDVRYRSGGEVAGLFQRAQEAVRAIPGVDAAGAVSAGELFGGTETALAVATGATGSLERATVRWYDASPGYFPTVGRRIVRGRNLAPTDVAGGPAVAVVNERLADRFWPGADPVGRRVTLPDDSASFEVVGVVRNATPLNPDVPAEAEIFWSNLQRPRWATYLVIRTAGAPAGMMRVLGDRLHDLDPDLQVSAPMTLAERAGRALVRPRFNASLVAGFSLLALVLAAVGVYGLQSYAVAQRTREFGIRLALGATPRMIRRDVLLSGRRTVILAVIAGVAGVLLVARPLRPLLAGVGPSDVISLVTAVAVLVLAAVAASLVPARRAGRVDPVESLRQE